MELIKSTNLNFHTGTKDILIDTNFRILEGQKYGLIGANGSGKTTLIRMIMGELEPEKGSLFIKPDLKIGYLPQQPLYDEAQTIENFLLMSLSSLMEEMSRLEGQMGNPEISGDSDRMEVVLKEYQKVCDRFEEAGGYKAQEGGETLLRRLGLDNPMEQAMGTLSGGERSLVFFTRALLSQPELLILDEPGNHLDFLGLAWLENFLAGYPGAVIIVSHNRYLLEKCCTSLLDLDHARLKEFKGTYSALRVDKYRGALIEQSAFEASKKVQEKLEKKIKELQSIAMSQYNPPATVMSQLGAAKKKLADEKKKNLERPQIEESVLKLDFGEELSRSKIALQVKNFNYGFDQKELFVGAKMDIHCREKVALVGANGTGKSTFLKVLLDQGDWDSDGNLRLGPSQKIGYLSQVAKFHSDAVTIEDEIRSWGALSKDGAFALARHFSFTYEDLEKSLEVLSGGEVNRLQLAKLMYLKTNFLILDEPTNHMDIQSREMIEEAVEKFPGTVLVVSHDRYFLDKLVDRVVEIDNKAFKSYQGNFSEYFKAKYPVLPRMSGEVSRRGKDRKRSVEAGLDIQTVERRIQEAEDEKLVLEKTMKSALTANGKAAGQKAAVQLEKLASRLEKLYSQWEALG